MASNPRDTELFIDRGNTFELKLIISGKTIDPLTNNVVMAPEDLTGSTFDMQARTSVDSPAIEFELSTTNGRITIDAPATSGAITLKITDEDTAGFNLGTFVYDLKWNKANGDETIIMGGSITIRESVTR